MIISLEFNKCFFGQLVIACARREGIMSCFSVNIYQIVQIKTHDKVKEELKGKMKFDGRGFASSNIHQSNCGWFLLFVFACIVF